MSHCSKTRVHLYILKDFICPLFRFHLRICWLPHNKQCSFQNAYTPLTAVLTCLSVLEPVWMVGWLVSYWCWDASTLHSDTPQHRGNSLYKTHPRMPRVLTSLVYFSRGIREWRWMEAVFGRGDIQGRIRVRGKYKDLHPDLKLLR